MRVIIDIMGGDHAPAEILKGTLEAAKSCNASIVLVGHRDRLRQIADDCGYDLSGFETVHAESAVSMDDDPITAVQKKKESSMMTGLRLLADGKGDAFVSAGNTGALFAGATFIVKRAPGVRRAAIGTVLPGTAPCLLLDAGANVSVTDEYLEQFAIVGSAYMRSLYGIAEPTVGLLNNGTEACKGTQLQIDANKRLSANQTIRYVGNVEASSALFGCCDVLVCDGFTGNILLKSIEGMGKKLLRSFKDAYTKNLLTELSYLPVKKVFREMIREFDPAERGGSPILGISKPVIKAHGASDARAFKNAVFRAIRYTESGVTAEIGKAAEQFAASKATGATP